MDTSEKYDSANRPNNYYEGLLSDENQRLMAEWNYIAGSVESFFSNVEVYEDNFDEISGFNASALTKDGSMESEVADAFMKSLLMWIKSERDEVVTSMIDKMDDAEYTANYKKVFGVEP